MNRLLQEPWWFTRFESWQIVWSAWSTLLFLLLTKMVLKKRNGLTLSSIPAYWRVKYLTWLTSNSQSVVFWDLLDSKWRFTRSFRWFTQVKKTNASSLSWSTKRKLCHNSWIRRHWLSRSKNSRQPFINSNSTQACLALEVNSVETKVSSNQLLPLHPDSWTHIRFRLELKVFQQQLVTISKLEWIKVHMVCDFSILFLNLLFQDFIDLIKIQQISSIS